MDEQNEWKNLPLPEKISHKNWKARIEGYSELEKQILKLDEENGFYEYLETFKRIPFDTNLPAQEKALDIILKIIKMNLNVSKQISNELAPGIVSKCLSSKPKLKAISAEIFLQFIENEDKTCVIAALKNGLSAKQPKIISACVDIFTQALKNFGPLEISFKSFVEDAVKLLEHGDKSYIIIYCDEGKAYDHEEVDIIDPLQLIEPVDVLSKISEQFYTDIIEPKWQIRKECLDKAENILNTIKISAEGDYSTFLAAIKRIITSDTNINVVVSAVKCIHFLSKGVGKPFSHHASSLLPLIIEKFKEKRGSIVEACRTCVDSLFYCLNIDSVLTIVFPYFKNKSPYVKEESLRYVGRIILKNSKLLTKPVYKIIVTEHSKILEDSVQSVREIAFDNLAQLMQIIGENNILMYLEGLDDIKKAKLNETFNLKNKPEPTENAQKSEKKISNKQKAVISKALSIEKEEKLLIPPIIKIND
ncbi:hypothetical protein MXB_2712, partial [Myxobolus squamalis]